MSKHYVDTFRTEQEVLSKIEELKLQGYAEEDMYVMARHKDELSLVRGRTDVDLESSEGNWMDKFKAFVTGDSPVREAFNRMGMEREDAERYYDDVRQGAILLYADNEYDTNDSTNPNYVDENLSPHPTSLESDHKVTGTNFTSESTHTESGSDHGKNLEPSVEDKKKFGDGTFEKQSDDAVDAGTPRNAIRPDQEGHSVQETSVDNGEWQDHDRGKGDSGTLSNKKEETVWVNPDKQVDNRHVDVETDDKNRLYGGQAQSDENPNEFNHDVDPNEKNGDHDRDKTTPGLSKDRGDKIEEERRLLQEETVFRNKDRF